MLDPSPTDGQIEEAREVAHLVNVTDADFYLKRLTQAQWDATLDDLTEWAKVKNKHTRIKGDGMEIDKSRNRLDITNRVRGRFGLRDLDTDGRVVSDYDFESEGSASIEVVGVF